MRAREDDGARVGFEKQVPACRVPRGRLDSEAATRRRQDPTGNECGCVKRSRSRTGLPTPNPPVALSLALTTLGLRERTNRLRRGAQARALPPLSPPSENQYVDRTVLSPAKSQFLHTMRVVEPSYFGLSSSLILPACRRRALVCPRA